MRRTSVLILLAAVVASAALVAAPSSATTLDTFTVSPSSTPGGTTVTVSATWTSTQAEEHELSLVIPQTLVDAGASWSGEPTSTVPTSVANGNFCASAVLDPGCLWRPTDAGQTNTMTAVLTLPASATPGAYDIVARSVSTISDATSQTQILTVLAPTPTASPSPTASAAPTATSSGPAVPTAVPAGAKGEDGGSLPWAALIALVLASLAAAAFTTRRRGRHEA